MRRKPFNFYHLELAPLPINSSLFFLKMRQICPYLKDMSATIAVLAILITLTILLTWRVTKDYYEKQEKIRQKWREPLISVLTAVAITLVHRIYLSVKRERDQKLSWERARHHTSWSIKERIASIRET